MPMVANKKFDLRAKESYEPGQIIPPASWDSLRERTRRALVSARFVVMAPETAAGPATKKKGSA